MKYFLLLVLCSVISFNTAETLLNSVEDYYWRDYLGLIPIDALVGGKNKAGETTFIGQMTVRVSDYIQDKTRIIDTFPAIITPRNKTVVATYAGQVITSNNSSNVKVSTPKNETDYYILCTRNVAHYSWHNQSLPVQPGCHYIVAGWEKFMSLYVGKAAYNDQITLTGKIFSDDDYLYGKTLFVPHETKGLALQNYKTLMYCV